MPSQVILQLLSLIGGCLLCDYRDDMRVSLLVACSCNSRTESPKFGPMASWSGAGRSEEKLSDYYWKASKP
jgi:hypothetical protein